MVAVDIKPILAALESVLPTNDGPVSLHEPWFMGNEWAYVKECLDTGWVSSIGKYVDQFETMLAAYTGAQHAVAVVNGTAALHTCLKLVGVEAGDEVLVPTLTFVATPNAVAYCGAEPHFVDSEEKSLGLDTHRLSDYLREIADVRSRECFNKRTGARIKAVICTHTFGHPVDLDPLLELCERFKLPLIEDAAESLGSYYKGRHTGAFGILGALSFNGNKIVTTGGGGAILTSEPSLAKLAKHVTTTARVANRWSFAHDQVGYNYRLPNINAALGCAQLEQLPVFLEKKRALARKYAETFNAVPGANVFTEPAFAKSNYWLNALILDEPYADQKDLLLEMAHQRRLMARPVWTLSHKLPMYQRCPRMELPVAETLEQRLINLPSSAVLGGLDG